MDVDKLIAFIGIIIAILGVVDSGLQRYARANTSKYAAQRDFEHLRRNQEQFKETLKTILDDTDRLDSDLIKIRTQLDILLGLKKE